MKINKKNLLAGCGLALVLGACSNDELPAVDANPDPSKEVTITLNLSVDGHVVLYGRAGENEYEGPRQMLTEESQQCVNDVRLYVFGSDDKDGPYLFEGAKNELGYWINPDGCYLVTSEGVFDNKKPWVGDGDETHTYEIRPRLKNGRYYKFLAVGRDDKYATPISDEVWSMEYPWWFGKKTLKDCNFIEGETNFEEASIEISRKSNKKELYEPNYVTEIFTGCLSTEDGFNKEEYIYLDPKCDNFIGTIYMRRAVAGLFALITDIPRHVTDDETGIEFYPDELNLLLSVCATKTNLKNRCDASEEHFHDIIIGQVDFRCPTKFNKNLWVRDDEINRYLREPAEYNGMPVPANTTMMSNFIMPVDIPLDDDTCEATLVLQYYRSQNNGHVIRSQKLNCTIVEIGINGEQKKVDPTNTGKKFSIKANNLYVLCEGYDIHSAIHIADFSRIGDKIPVEDPDAVEDNPNTNPN